VADVAVLSARCGVWGMRGVVGRVLRAVEGPRGAAVGVLAPFLQGREKGSVSWERSVSAGSLASLHRGVSQRRNYLFAVEATTRPSMYIKKFLIQILCC